MSTPIQSIPTSTGEFQAHFGSAPGTTDAVAECKKWERLCAEVIAERERLREELAKAQRDCDLYRKSLFREMCKDYKPDYDRSVAFAHLDDTPTVQEIITELERAPEK